MAGSEAAAESGYSDALLSSLVAFATRSRNSLAPPFPYAGQLDFDLSPANHANSTEHASAIKWGAAQTKQRYPATGQIDRRNKAPGHRVKALLNYLASLNGARQALWGYLIWYIVVLVRYFDPRPRLWFTSLGLSGIIGIALILSTAGTSVTTKLDRWQLFRLFLMPFCVSSFAALVKDRGFILVFSPDWRDLAIGGGLILLFLGAVRIARVILRTDATPPATDRS